MPTTNHKPVSGQQFADEQSAEQPSLPQPISRTSGLLNAMLSHQAEVSPPNTRVDGVLIGWLAGIDDHGTPMVMVPELLPGPRPAVSLCPLTADHVGAQCAVMFGDGHLGSPILMGMLHHNVLALSHTGEAQVQDDGRSLRIEHAKEIALHCGKASLRLTRDGRIELRGTTLISHSSGLNRVRGASVKLN